MDYKTFIEQKEQLKESTSIIARDDEINPMLYDFQRVLLEWALKKGRAAIYADCGLGKTPLQLSWADVIVKRTNKPVLVLTPLAVSYQTVREGEKFGIECIRSDNGEIKGKIIITNYERLHYFNKNSFIGVVCDESSILKHFTGSRQKEITDFMKKIPYRLLCTATAAPNDYYELGTSAEALGVMGHMDMLSTFFKSDDNCMHIGRFKQSNLWWQQKWHFKAHAEIQFWKWVSSWARALRKPSDIGFSDERFILPPLQVEETIVKASRPLNGNLFIEPAFNIKEQREERKMTIQPRCEEIKNKVNGTNSVVVWCQYNEEGDLLEKIIPDAQQVKGADESEKKEELLLAFTNGTLRVLVTKPKIGAFGLNWQHCNHMTFFPSHSFEQYYQGVRRCWRFGQKNSVKVDIITTEGEMRVLKNLQRKEEAANKMYDMLVSTVNNALILKHEENFNSIVEVPTWL